jgi:hypothetical protein
MIKNVFIICFIGFVFFSYFGQGFFKTAPQSNPTTYELIKLADQQNNEAIQKGELTDPKLVEKLSGGPIKEGSGIDIADAYPTLEGDPYEKYRGYISDPLIDGRQLSVDELNKMLEENKKAEQIKIIIYIVISIGVIILLFFIKRYISKNIQSKSEDGLTLSGKSTIELDIEKNKQEETNESFNPKINIDGFITQIEKLNNLKEKGAITDSEFEELKKRIIN